MKIMKRLRDLEMKLIKGKKIKFIFFLFSFFFICCQQPIENKILGSWEIDHVSFSDGSISNVPNEERYTMVISKKANKKTFTVDNIQGTWYLKDSLLFLKIFHNRKPILTLFF
jgi:hypothetical protein